MQLKPSAVLCSLCLAGLLTGCASTRPAFDPPSGSVAPSRASILQPNERAARIAERQIGIRYRYGGTTPASGFDCSGLVHYSFAQAGITVPRTSRDQFRASKKISLADAQPGDIVFFQDQAKLSHVGIYLGDGRFVHAPSSGKTVSVASIDSPYYQEHLVAVGRLEGS